MNIKELEKLVNHEIDWLQYYGWRKSRENLTIESNIYEDLISIGYTKKVMSLDQRCAGAILTSKEPIVEGLDIENIYIIYTNRNVNENRYTPLEVYLILFPEKKLGVIEKIKNY
jgi:hypothetical protein